MLAKACSCAVIGLYGALVEVEVDIGHGLPAFSFFVCMIFSPLYEWGRCALAATYIILCQPAIRRECCSYSVVNLHYSLLLFVTHNTNGHPACCCKMSGRCWGIYWLNSSGSVGGAGLAIIRRSSSTLAHSLSSGSISSRSKLMRRVTDQIHTTSSSDVSSASVVVATFR
jgi:hypothetical protein